MMMVGRRPLLRAVRGRITRGTAEWPQFPGCVSAAAALFWRLPRARRRPLDVNRDDVAARLRRRRAFRRRLHGGPPARQLDLVAVEDDGDVLGRHRPRRRRRPLRQRQVDLAAERQERVKTHQQIEAPRMVREEQRDALPRGRDVDAFHREGLEGLRQGLLGPRAAELAHLAQIREGALDGRFRLRHGVRHHALDLDRVPRRREPRRARRRRLRDALAAGRRGWLALALTRVLDRRGRVRERPVAARGARVPARRVARSEAHLTRVRPRRIDTCPGHRQRACFEVSAETRFCVRRQPTASTASLTTTCTGHGRHATARPRPPRKSRRPCLPTFRQLARRLVRKAPT
mmetsp:Transcript_13774/g.41118  ORF Transcript_13774/g.41118 Transcript_13774/m.41118 type:complete len:346 (-) Transcript_13774:111-1148(-)